MKKPIFDIDKYIKKDIWPISEIRRQVDKYEERGKGFNIDKCILIFLHDENVQGFYFDTTTFRIVIGQSTWRGRFQESQFWGDNDSRNFATYCSDIYGFRPTKNEVDEALFACTTNEKNGHIVNSLIAYMDGLRDMWDGKERLGNILSEVCGAPKSDYTSEVMKKFMVGAVGRIYEPGKKFDNVLMLHGGQGSGKSSFSSLLAPGDEDFYASLDFSMMDDIKKTGELLQGKLVVELEEMGGLRKTSQKKVKSGITRKCDRYRECFNRFSDDHYRTNVFIGTVNPEAGRGVLTDMTGNRRYWPVSAPGRGLSYTQIKKIMDDQRDQLWAEALFYYCQGMEPILSPEAEAEAEKRRSRLLDVDVTLIDTINDYLSMNIIGGRTRSNNGWEGQSGWDKLTLYDKRDFWDNFRKSGQPGTGMKREHTCVEEIWMVCLKNDKKPTRQESQQILSLFGSNQIDGWYYTGERKYFGIMGSQRSIEPNVVII